MVVYVFIALYTDFEILSVGRSAHRIRYTVVGERSSSLHCRPVHVQV